MIAKVITDGEICRADIFIEELGISRQGVHDMIRRCNRTLEEYEEKLHLVEKFLNIRSQVIKIHELADKYHAEDIAAISNVILEEL